MIDSLVNDIQQSWEEYYRPNCLDDFILLPEHRQLLHNMIVTKQLKNLIISSKKGGSGKTSLAKFLPRVFDADGLFVNGSKDGGIGQLDLIAIQLESSSLFNESSYKVVIFDESDGTSDSFKKAVKGFIEKYQDRARFIYTTNHIHKISEHELSRLTQLSFDYSESQLKILRPQLKEKLIQICNERNVQYVESAIDFIVNKYAPDFRKSIEILEQTYLTYGCISDVIITSISSDDDDTALIMNIVLDFNTPFDVRFRQFEELIKTDSSWNKIIHVIDEKLIPYCFENKNNSLLAGICKLNSDTIYQLKDHYYPEILMKNYFCQINYLCGGLQ